MTYLERRALSRHCGKANDVAEVYSDQVESLGFHADAICQAVSNGSVKGTCVYFAVATRKCFIRSLKNQRTRAAFCEADPRFSVSPRKEGVYVH